MTDQKSLAAKASAALKKAKDQGSFASLNTQEIGAVMERYKVAIAKSLPRQLGADRMIQMAVTMISSNDDLKACSVTSVIGAMLQAASLGFKPVPSLGQCYFVPRNRNIGSRQSPKWVKECQFEIGYRGYIDLCERSGKLRNIYSYAVRDGEEFHVEYGVDPTIRHIPKFDNEAQITHVYAVAHFQNGGTNFVVLTIDEVEKLRLLSPNQKVGHPPSGIWAAHYEAMAKAKAVRQLSKWLPLSDQEKEAITTDGAIIPVEAFTESGLQIEKVQHNEGDEGEPEA